MLTHPTLEQMRALKLDGMAEAFIELEAQERAKDLSHAEWLALLLDRETASRSTRRFQIQAQERQAAALPGVRRGCRLPGIAPARQGAVPAAGNLPLDRRAPLLARHRAMRGGQVVAQLRAGAEGLPRRLHGALRTRAAAVCRVGAGAR